MEAQTLRTSKRPFKIESPFSPSGDQPGAIEALTRAFRENTKEQVLLGVTGSGKTFTMAHVIQALQKPTLIMSHNKTLAAQLYEEFRRFFPNNAVEYFVSYYDYYQPEAYVPQTDTFIEKEAQINDELDKLRHSTTRSLLERKDVIVVSSVSCIYGLGSPEEYAEQLIPLQVGQNISRQNLLRKLNGVQYKRQDVDFHRGTYRVRGDRVEIFPAYEEALAVRVELFGQEIERLTLFDPLTGATLGTLDELTLFPASHYVTQEETRARAIESIRTELRERLQVLHSLGKNLEAQRLEQRTLYDLENFEQLGFCAGIENYSRHLTGRNPGDAPPTLLDFFPAEDWLLIVDESHVTLPQIGGMYRGDRARKTTLVEHGFRLPSALDNRPLRFDEWDAKTAQVLFVSATPGPTELERTQGEIVEQVNRPTGLLDPKVEIRPASSQINDLLVEFTDTVAAGGRIMITTLTKRLAEDLSQYYSQQGLRVKYLHSDIDTLERIDMIRDLRMGVYDGLIGINLLREGLDCPEVTLVAILDADKEGFLRSKTALIQTIGRAARNLDGRVILYADKETKSIREAVYETERRRLIQESFNLEHGRTPRSVQKAIPEPITTSTYGDAKAAKAHQTRQILRSAGSHRSSQLWKQTEPSTQEETIDTITTLLEVYFPGETPNLSQLDTYMDHLKEKMQSHAKALEFEEAARTRDAISRLKSFRLGL